MDEKSKWALEFYSSMKVFIVVTAGVPKDSRNAAPIVKVSAVCKRSSRAEEICKGIHDKEKIIKEKLYKLQTAVIECELDES